MKKTNTKNEHSPGMNLLSQKSRNWLFYLSLIVALISINNFANAQQVIGSFPVMNGGFEGQAAGSLGTALSSTLWTRQGAAGSSGSIVASGGRSGPNYATVTNGATVNRGLQSPQDPVAANGPAQNTAYTVQFFVRNAAAVTAPQVGVNVNGTANTNYTAAAGMTSINASFTKQTVAATSPNVAVATAGIAVIGRSTTGTFDIDDVVIYAGAADVTAPTAPTSPVVNNPTSASLDVSWTAPGGGVDGGGYVVVRYITTAPVAADDPNQNGIYAVGNTFVVGGGATGTVRYIGTGTSFTDAVGLLSGTTYYYKVYAVDKAFNYSPESSNTGTSGTTTSFTNATNLSVDFSTGTEAAATVVTATATCATAAVGAQTVNIAVSGTNITVGDYTLSNAQITIANGATSGSVTFTIVNDVINEGPETAILTISSPTSGLTLGATVTQNVAITDDDDVLPLAVLNTLQNYTFDDLSAGGALVKQGAYSARNVTLNSYTLGTGSSNAGAIYSFGVTGTNPSTDRAFGSVASGTFINYYGFKVVNNTGGNINAIDVSYTGEQWRAGAKTGAEVLAFEYSLSATTINDATPGVYSTINALQFTTPITTGAGVALDGNAPANRTVISTITVGLGTIPPGGTFFIRWKDLDDASADHGYGIDDLNITPRFITPVVFYSKDGLPLELETSWGDNADGSGNNPPNFTNAGQVFHIANQTGSATIGGNWTVSGGAANVIIDAGFTFTVPAAFTFTGPIDLAATSNLIINSAGSNPTFGSLATSSTVTFGASSGTQDIDNGTYGNLILSGAGIKNILGATTVNGNLTFDGCTLDKSVAAFQTISYAGNISVLSPCTYNANYLQYVTLATLGNTAQTIFGNGNVLSASQFNSTKTGGSLSLSTVGGSTNVTTKDDIRFNFSGSAVFNDGGNVLSVGGDFENDGITAGYNLTGTLTMTGITSAVGGISNIRLNGAGGSGVAGVADLNNVIIDINTPTITNQVSFQPVAGGATFTTIKGNLTIQGNSTYSGGVRFGTNASTAVRLQGNFIGTLATSVVYPTTGAIQFDGSSPQTFTTSATAGETFPGMIINNSTGVTLSSGDVSVNGNLNCNSGVLTTGSNNVILTTTGSITETTTSNVIGFVQTTRNVTNALQTFGGIGFEITAAGAQPGSTLLVRKTGTAYVAGCTNSSIKRKYTLTPTVNAGLNATISFGYLESVAELNGIAETALATYEGGGPWTILSSIADLNTTTNKITTAGINALGEYVAASIIPIATAGGSAISCENGSVTVSGAFADNGSYVWTANVGATGILTGAGTLTPTYTPAAGDAGNTVTLTLTVTPISPCAIPATAIYTIDVRPRPTVSPVAVNICTGSPIGTMTIVSPEASTDYKWTPATDLYTDVLLTTAYISGNSATTVYTAPFTSTSYSVTATNTLSGCTTGATIVNVVVCPAATNDICQADAVTAIPVTTTGTFTQYSLAGATPSIFPSCATVARDIWYRAIVPSNGEINVITLPGNNATANLNIVASIASIFTATNCSTAVVLATGGFGCDANGGAGNMSYAHASNLSPGSTVYIRLASLGGIGSPNAVSAQYIRVAVTSGLVWTASANDDFNNPANYSGGDASALTVPTASISAIVPSTVTKPRLATADGTVRGITFNSVAPYYVSPGINLNGFTLNVKGNWAIGPVATASTTLNCTGTVEFNGTSALFPQVITGKTTFGNVNFNNTAAPVNVSGSTPVTCVLKTVAGTVASNDNIILRSSAANTAALVDPGALTGAITGNVSVERKIGTIGGYHYLSSAVSGAIVNNTTTGWRDDFTINAATDNIPYIPGQTPNSNFSTVWEYDETASGVGYGYVGATGTGDAITPLKGFACVVPANVVVDVFGPINNGSIPGYNVTLTDDGINFIGNPYPSPISWASFRATNSTRLSNIGYYAFKTTGGYAGSFAWWDGSASTPALVLSDVIASSQGFVAIASTAGSNPITAVNTNRIVAPAAVSGSFFSDSDTRADVLRMDIAGNGFADQTMVRFDNGAADTYDSEMDAKKLFSMTPGVPAIYTIAENRSLIGNVMGKLNMDKVVPMGVKTTAAGTYQISVYDMSSFASSVVIYLEDTQAGTTINLRNQPSYSVTLAEGEFNNRFYLHFHPAVALTAINESCAGNDGKLEMNYPSSSTVSAVVKNSAGAVVSTQNNVNGLVTIGNLVAGNYSVDMTFGIAPSTYTTTDYFTVAAGNAVTSSLSASAQNVDLAVSGTVNFTATSQGATSFNWNFGDGTIMTGPANVSHTFTTPGTYDVTFEATNGICTSIAHTSVSATNTTGIGSVNTDQLNVYASNSKVVVQFGSKQEGKVNIDVLNNLGQVITHLENIAAKGKREIDLSNVAVGQYMVRITSTEQVFTQKVFLARQ